MRYLTAETKKPISKIGLGTWQFGSRGWDYGDRYATVEAGAIVRRAVELGVTLFDTGEVYGVDERSLSCRALGRGVAVVDPKRLTGFGRSERILGDGLAGRTAAAFVATKFYPAAPYAPSVRRHALASARRLRTPTIDLYQVHARGRLAAHSRVMHAVRGLQRDGIVGDVGLSNGTLAQWHAMEEALDGRVLADQVPYSLVDRAAERELIPYARSHGRVIIAYSPLAHGLLSDRYDRARRPVDPVRAADPRFLPDNLDRAADLLATVRAVAASHAATASQIALAWAIREPNVAAIPGAATVEQLEHNVAAADIRLADDEYDALAAAAATFHPVGPPPSRSERLRGKVGTWLG